ncbi:MAG: 30S ribosomal protein S15 [Deltaproteobacteria bacterium]|nr:30S ribosomal protein S15 [Deltaproteobacteria bacterium]
MGSSEMSGKQEVIAKHRINDKDTGSPEVQIALLTKRLEILTEHLKQHPQDLHTQRGMYQMVSRRKRLLNYLRNESVERYRNTLGALGLRK